VYSEYPFMIKFFRHIRQRMIKENRVSKYLLYAIGEIVLVIIGILFALQINTWNTERIAMKESKEFSRRLLSEVKINIAATENQILKEKSQLNSALAILKMFHTDRSLLNARELDSLVYIVMTKNRVDLSMATLNEGLNTGKIPLIPSDSLRGLLYGFPTVEYKVRDAENVCSIDIDNFLTPFLYEHLNWRKMDVAFSPNKDKLGISAFPEHNSLESLDHIRFENLMDNIYFNSNGQLNNYQALKHYLESIKSLLEK